MNVHQQSEKQILAVFVFYTFCNNLTVLVNRSVPEPIHTACSVFLIMLLCFVHQQDRCQPDASWMSRSERKWAPVRWTRSDSAPPKQDGSIMLIKLFIKAEWEKQVDEGVIGGSQRLITQV